MDSETLHTAVVNAVADGLEFAQRHLLHGDRTLLADSWSPGDLPADERERLLQLLISQQDFSEAEVARHLGEAPIPADRRTHLMIVDSLRQHFPHCYVVGEEASDNEWDAAVDAPQSSLIFQIDAIDGSLPYDSLTFGFSVNLLAFERGPGFARDKLLLAAVINSSGFLALYEQGLGASIGTPTELTLTTEPLDDEFRIDSVAALGALPRHRSLISGILRDDALTIFTTAGAPAAMGLIAGRLAVLVATKPQTLHDAAFLPIVAALGIPILVDGGVVLGMGDVEQLFSSVARKRTDREAHPIPRFVVARNPVVGATLARTLFSEQGS